MYYNTIPLNDVSEEARRCASQEEFVFRFFSSSPDKDYTRDEIYEMVHAAGRTMILSSVGRSLTDLAGAGKIAKNGKRRKGRYGLQNCYQLK